MNWLTNLKIKYKILLMLFFPIIGLLYFSLVMVTEKHHLAHEMDNLEDLATITIKVANLIHQVQLERLISVKLLKQSGDQLNRELTEERLKTDHLVNDLKNSLEPLETLKFNSHFQTHLSQVIETLQALFIQREDIKNRRISELKTIEGYGHINSVLIDFIKEIATLSTNKDVFTLELAYINFIAAKELAALERSLLVNTLTQKYFERSEFQYFVTLVAQQQIYQKMIFMLLATDEQKAFFEQKVSGQFIDETQKIRKMLYATANDGVIENIDPKFWAKMQTGKIELLKEVETKLANDLRAKTLTIQNRAYQDFIIALIAVLIILILAMIFVVLILTGMTQRLRTAVDIANAIAKGNLTHQIDIKARDETGQLLQAHAGMQNQLRNIITTIQQTIEVVTHAAEEIAQGNLSLSQRTEQQAASLEQTAASMEQMTSTVQQNADNAKQANQLALNAKERAEQGGEVVNSAILAMTEISKSSQKITDIIVVIDEIAFQTNLLALNAAVEAARAGEQGRGFAVVATEVRNLAQRSAAAAKEIKELIQDSVAKVEEGTKLANQSGSTLEEIMIAVKKVNDIISEIAAASQEQSAGIHQVNKAVSQMDEMTQQNASLVEEAALASDTMKEQVQTLRKQITFFDVGQQELPSRAQSKPALTKPSSSKDNQSQVPPPHPAVSPPSSDDNDWQDF